jgi:tetratricopeptide (TPR) repeat protein
MFISRILPYLTTSLRNSVYVDALNLWFIITLLAIIGCGISNDQLIQQYNDFAIRSAQANLWNEAILRWQRIIEIDPQNAKAHNNLGVAYEATERFDEALAEYEAAIELDPSNKAYRRNLFQCQRNKRRSWHTEGKVKENEAF